MFKCISTTDLKAQAHAYIVENRIVKWRFDSLDRESPMHTLNVKQYNGEPLTEEEYRYVLKNHDNIVIERGEQIQLIRFSLLTTDFNVKS